MQYHYGNFGFIKHEKMLEQPLVLLDLGIEHRFQEPYAFDNSARSPYTGYVFQLTLQGYGIYETTGQVYVLQAGQGFFTKCPSDSRYSLPDSSYPTLYQESGWDYFYLHFDGPAAESFYRTVQELYGEVVQVSTDSPCVKLFLQLFEKCRHMNHLDLYEGSEFLYRFLCQMLRSMEAPTLQDSPLITQAISYIKEHFTQLDSIRDVSAYCGVSHEHLTRCFRKETGQSPLQFLTKLRIEHALFLLLNTSKTVDCIAKDCGFQNGNYFSKVFRKYLQCSPDAYRQMNL